MTCQPDACTQADVPQIRRTHSPSRCPERPPESCDACGQTLLPAEQRVVRVLTDPAL